MIPTLLATLSLIAAPAPVNVSCAYDEAAMLALPYAQFNDDNHGGWRALGQDRHCFKEASDLLAAYRKAHWSSLTEQQAHLMLWHEGQGRAIVGDYETAAPLLLAGTDPSSPWDGDDYTIGTVAFLKRDLPSLKAAQARMHGIAKPTDWAKTSADAKAKLGYEIAWPPNSDVLDGLVRCFDRSYEHAYGDADCRSAGPAR